MKNSNDSIWDRTSDLPNVAQHLNHCAPLSCQPISYSTMWIMPTKLFIARHYSAGEIENITS